MTNRLTMLTHMVHDIIFKNLKECSHGALQSISWDEAKLMESN